jgi:hypothetical protein
MVIRAAAPWTSVRHESVFLRTGVGHDVFDGEPYWTQVCRGEVNPNCP